MSEAGILRILGDIEEELDIIDEEVSLIYSDIDVDDEIKRIRTLIEQAKENNEMSFVDALDIILKEDVQSIFDNLDITGHSDEEISNLLEDWTNSIGEEYAVLLNKEALDEYQIRKDSGEFGND